MKRKYLIFIIITLTLVAFGSIPMITVEKSDDLNSDIPENVLNFLKQNYESAMKDWPHGYVKNIEPPVPLKDGYSLFRVNQLLGGGDYSSFLIMVANNNITTVKLSELAGLIKPLKNKKQALEYYIFYKYKNSGAFGNTQFIIKDKSDYDSSTIRYNGGLEGVAEMKDRVSQVFVKDDHYSIEIIGFNFIGEIEFFYQKALVYPNGQVEDGKRQQLINLGTGALF